MRLKALKKKTRTIDKILKELTPERIKKELAAIQAVELPPELQKWVKEYEKVGDRDPFLWKWAYCVSANIKLPFVQKKYDQKLIYIKFLIIMLITLVDDIADKKHDLQFLKNISDFSFNRKNFQAHSLRNGKNLAYFTITYKTWVEIKKLLNGFPNFQKLSSIIEFDFKQIWNSMIYACLTNNNPDINNKEENRIYLSNSTPAILSYMIDLSCFDGKIDIGAIRSIGWYCQMMVRISNTLATYEREVSEKDLSGEMFVDSAEYKNKKVFEQKLIEQWDEYYNTLSMSLSNFSKQTKKIILDSIKKVLIIHIVSRGKI